MLMRLGEIAFEVPQVRTAGFYPGALERGSSPGAVGEPGFGRNVRARRLDPQGHRGVAKAGRPRGQHLLHPGQPLRGKTRRRAGRRWRARFAHSSIRPM